MVYYKLVITYEGIVSSSMRISQGEKCVAEIRINVCRHAVDSIVQ